MMDPQFTHIFKDSQYMETNAGIGITRVETNIGNSLESNENKVELVDISNSNVQNSDFYSKNGHDNNSSENLQNLLELNVKLIEGILAARDKMQNLLQECNERLKSIDEQIQSQSSWQSKIVHFNAGMPYFKDKNYYTAQRNEDTETKIKRGELRLTQLPRIQRWNQLDKSNLLKAIRHEVNLTLLNRDEPEENDQDNSIKKASQLPLDVRKVIGTLGSIKFDWLKIANNLTENKHSAEECEVMWNVFLHPDINKQKWTSREDKELNRIVEEHDFEDWDAIAKALKTNRSGYQCFIRYNTNNWKNLMKGQCWSLLDDKNLTYLVSQLKIGDYIPWGYIASCMNNWTKQQAYFRWNYSLAPHLKKGRFSPEEDKILLDAVKKYGPNFSKISALVITNRTSIQLKEHYHILCQKTTQDKKIWTYEEDELLIQLQKKYGSNWAEIVKHMPLVSRIQARQRYVSLLRYQKKGIQVKNIRRNDDEPPISSTHTTVTYTTNTPWSRENKEIHVIHLKIDDQLINFFKAENKKQKKKLKLYEPNELERDTKKLYDTLIKLNVNISIPEYFVVHDEISEKYLELLSSLQSYVQKRNDSINENIEHVRLKMFGPQEPVPKKQRFIPPLPFNFCVPRNSKNDDTNNIDFNLDHNENYQIVQSMTLQPNKYITEFLGEDIEIQFEKFKNIMTSNTNSFERVYLLKCKPFANSHFFFNDIKADDESYEPYDVYTINDERPEMEYDWLQNKMVPINSSNEINAVNESVPVQLLEPNKSTLQAYQEILLTSNFSTDTIETDSNYHLTSRGRVALNLFKTRYQQLFHMPTGLSRIIPPDTVDESAFLPALEKFKKMNMKKRSKKSIKIVSQHHVKSV